MAVSVARLIPKRIRDQQDANMSPGAGTAGYAIVYNPSNDKFELGTFDAAISAAVAAHVAAGNPHSQYLLASGVSAYGATLIDDADAVAAAAITAAGLATTGSVPSAADVAVAVFAKAVESGYSLQTVLQKMFAAIAGKSITDDPQSPTWFEYYAPDGSTLRLRHEITETERTVDE